MTAWALGPSEPSPRAQVPQQRIILSEGDLLAVPLPPPGPGSNRRSNRAVSPPPPVPEPLPPEALPRTLLDPPPVPLPAPSTLGGGADGDPGGGVPGGRAGGTTAGTLGGTPGGSPGIHPGAPSPPRFDADYLNNPAPDYPALSRKIGEEGRVVLRVLVSPEGRPDAIEVKAGSGFPRLDRAAAATVARWRFVPARLGNQAVSAWVLVPVSFHLDL